MEKIFRLPVKFTVFVGLMASTMATYGAPSQIKTANDLHLACSLYTTEVEDGFSRPTFGMVRASGLCQGFITGFVSDNEYLSGCASWTSTTSDLAEAIENKFELNRRHYKSPPKPAERLANDAIRSKFDCD